MSLPPNDALQDLIRRTDDTTPPPRIPSGLAERVRIRTRRRRRASRAAGAVAALVVLAGFVAFDSYRRADDTNVAVSPTDGRHNGRADELARLEVRRELDRLRIDAEVHQRVADRLLAAERRGRARMAAQRLSGPDPLDVLAGQRDRAAILMLRQAERLTAEPAGRAAAVETYRRTADLFPRSQWAQVAQDRLKQLKM